MDSNVNGIALRPVEGESWSSSAGTMGGNKDEFAVDGCVADGLEGAVESADSVAATDLGRSDRGPGRGGKGTVTPGITSKGRLSIGAATAGFAAALVAGLAPEPGTARGFGVAGATVVTGGSRAGAESNGP